MRGIGKIVSKGSESLLKLIMQQIAEYIRDADPDYILERIERGDYPFLDDPRARKLERLARWALERLASRNPEILEIIEKEFNVNRVFLFIKKENPFIAGILYGHPRGLEWLNGLIEEIKRRIMPPIVEGELVEDSGSELSRSSASSSDDSVRVQGGGEQREADPRVRGEERNSTRV